MKSFDKCWSSPGQGHDSRENYREEILAKLLKNKVRCIFQNDWLTEINWDNESEAIIKIFITFNDFNIFLMEETVDGKVSKTFLFASC